MCVHVDIKFIIKHFISTNNKQFVTIVLLIEEQKFGMSVDKSLVLGKLIRVLLSDSRIIEGILLCIDKHLNLIMGDVTEYHTCHTNIINKQTISRMIGTATVPGIHVIKILLKKESN